MLLTIYFLLAACSFYLVIRPGPSHFSGVHSLPNSLTVCNFFLIIILNNDIIIISSVPVRRHG